MIGLLKDDGKPLLRAYSIASPSWDEELEFYSIKVQDGPLTSRLQHIKVGDQIILRLNLWALLSTMRCCLGNAFGFCNRDGIAPFASLIRDPQTYKYDQVILTHTCRDRHELDYGFDLVKRTLEDPLIGEMAQDKLIHYPTTTRETSDNVGRITDLLSSGKLLSDLDIKDFSAAHDRAMVCGSMGLNLDLKKILEEHGLNEGANSAPAEFVVEKAFVG